MYSSWNATPRAPGTARKQASVAARFFTDQLAAGHVSDQTAEELARALQPLIERRLLESPKFKLSLSCDDDHGACGLLAELLREVVSTPAHGELTRRLFEETRAVQRPQETYEQALARISRFERHLHGQLVVDDKAVEAYEQGSREARLLFCERSRPVIDPLENPDSPPQHRPDTAGSTLEGPGW